MLLAFYFVFIGGSSYYTLVWPVRIMHHALVTFVFGLWLFKRIRQGRGIPATPLNPLLYALMLVWFVAGFLGLDWRMSLEHTWFMVTHVLIFWLLVDLIQQGRQKLVLETQFLLGALIILLAGLQLFSWYFGLGFTPETTTGWFEVLGPGAWIPLRFERLWLGMGVSTWMAAYSAPLAILCAGWALSTNKWDFRTVLWGMAVALAGITLLTFSRGGLVSLGASALIFISLRLLRNLNLRDIGSRQNLLPLAVMAGMVVAVLLAVFVIGQNPGRISGDAKRLELWRSAGEIISDNPVLGVGTGMFGRAVRSYRDPALADSRLSTAHNLPLNTTAEIGLLGLLLCVALGGVLLRHWWINWRTADDPTSCLRLEVVYAALAGVAAQSLFDNFMMTSVVSLFLVLLAYSVADRHVLPDEAQSLSQWMNRAAGVLLLVLMAGYGLWFIQVDRAFLSSQGSLRASGAEALQAATAAAQIDPALRLYSLQIDYLTADVAETGSAAAIAAYEHALEIEPTWDTGWLNLAALHEQAGDIDAALVALERAYSIDYNNPAWLHWARLAEMHDLAPEAAIIESYVMAMRYQPEVLPLSDFWQATPLRQQAVMRYAELIPFDQRYRVLAVHDPGGLAEIVPENPQTGPEWWVVGEYALIVEGKAEKAITAFSNAIEQSRTTGDYYAARARAQMTIDRAAAARDLALAELLGTYYEFPNAIRAKLTDDPVETYELRVRGVPPRIVDQNFEVVLFNRTAQFDLLPAVRYVGPGRAIMQPWYDIAAFYEVNDNIPAAINAYEAILGYAPDESAAQVELERLNI